MPSALALTPLGVFHTAISLLAIAAGLFALARDRRIPGRRLLRRVCIAGVLALAQSLE
jgi:hypothetical protein